MNLKIDVGDYKMKALRWDLACKQTTNPSIMNENIFPQIKISLQVSKNNTIHGATSMMTITFGT